MIRKLRRKFILINMLLVSLVLVIVFVVLVGTNARQLAAQSAAAMRVSLEWSDESGPPRFEFLPPRDQAGPGAAPSGDAYHQRGGRQSMMIPVFCVSLEQDGGIRALHSRESVEVSEEILEQAVNQALEAGASEGILSSLGLRYLVSSGPDGAVRIAFADRGWERESLGSLVAASLLIGGGALLCFFLISLFLSTLATRPVARAWDQQRQFVADASHELKTPLTVILANSGILLSHREDTVGSQVKWIEYIREEAGHMKALVEDMLFLAKSDAARTPVSRLSVDMSEVAEGCLLPFEPVAFEQGVSLSSEIRPGLSVPGDETQLRRLVALLLDNACKYAGQGGGASLTLARVQDRVRLTVHNTGPAIPQAHLPHLFERFYRSDSARTREAGGYGLGLAIAKSITEAHRGKISVTSSQQAGTTFTVLLPASRA